MPGRSPTFLAPLYGTLVLPGPIKVCVDKRARITPSRMDHECSKIRACLVPPVFSSPKGSAAAGKGADSRSSPKTVSTAAANISCCRAPCCLSLSLSLKFFVSMGTRSHGGRCRRAHTRSGQPDLYVLFRRVTASTALSAHDG